MAERGTVVEGRIGGQAEDRFPQPGEAFRQILHVGGGFAGAGPGFLQEAAGIGPAAGHGGELVIVSGRCKGIEHRSLLECQDGVAGMPEEATPPDITRTAPAKPSSASACRAARTGGSRRSGAGACPDGRAAVRAARIRDGARRGGVEVYLNAKRALCEKRRANSPVWDIPAKAPPSRRSGIHDDERIFPYRTMTEPGGGTGVRQFDLFGDRGTVTPVAAPAARPPRPNTLSDEQLLARLPGARIAEAGPLYGLIVERGLGDRALPALERLWRRFAGFGQDRLLPEQVAVIETLAKIGTAAARELLAGIVTAPDLSFPLLPTALRAALAVSLRLPATFTGPLLAHGNPEIREFAIRLSAFGRPEFEGLEACLADTHAAVRRAAAIVLGGFGWNRAKAVLLAELARHPDGDVVDALAGIADDDIVVHLGRCAGMHPELAGRIASELEEMQTPRSLKIASRIRGRMDGRISSDRPRPQPAARDEGGAGAGSADSS